LVGGGRHEGIAKLLRTPAQLAQLALAPLLLIRRRTLLFVCLAILQQIEASHLAPRSKSAMTAIDVSRLDTGLLDAVVRPVRLVDAPTDARFLAPLVTREIVYQLFVGAQGSRLDHIAAIGGPTQRIVEAIERLWGICKTPYFELSGSLNAR
jgi:AraC-type transcriptional regulator N-terminus